MQMNDLSKQQGKQEAMYMYPYHYLPVLNDSGFAQSRNLAWGYEYLSYLHYIIDKTDALGYESLMDVGCGDGRLLSEIHRKHNDKKLVGIDYSQRAIDFARIINPDVTWICGDITTISSSEYRSDIITLIEVLEHIEPDKIGGFLSSLASHLDASGRLIVTVPSVNIPTNKKHYQHFSLATLGSVLEPYYDILDVVYLNAFNLTRKIIHKLLTNRLFIMNNAFILNACYKFYTKKLLVANEGNCSRIGVVCKKKQT